MKYQFHTTTHDMRLKLLEQEGNIIEINIDDFSCPTIAIDEDADELYQFDYGFMYITLQEFDNGITDPTKTTYYRDWAEKKGSDSCRNRIINFLDLYKDIKKNGLREPVVVEITGQKIDGSHRAAVMKHLGHKTIKAREVVLDCRDIDEVFIQRTLKAREQMLGKNYYYIDYGSYSNIPCSPVYMENSYDRWETLKGLIEGTVLDLGCNEGFMSIQCALNGHKTVGIEYEFADGANFNKIIFESKKGKLPLRFIDGDITKIDIPNCDTCLLLNVIYHIPRDKQVELVRKIDAKRIIFQANNRKAHEVENFRGCTIETIKEICSEAGRPVKSVIEWRDKPIVIA